MDGDVGIDCIIYRRLYSYVDKRRCQVVVVRSCDGCNGFQIIVEGKVGDYRNFGSNTTINQMTLDNGDGPKISATRQPRQRTVLEATFQRALRVPNLNLHTQVRYRYQCTVHAKFSMSSRLRI
eukprot:SAG31_NODE_3810_length_3862_cov_2.467712_4_plen_123_part_00